MTIDSSTPISPSMIDRKALLQRFWTPSESEAEYRAQLQLQSGEYKPSYVRKLAYMREYSRLQRAKAREAKGQAA